MDCFAGLGVGTSIARTKESEHFLVCKYGGSSLATVEQVRAVAREVAGHVTAAGRVVVVVSAMGDTTDRLLALAAEFTERPDPRELDQLVATGEQVAAAVLAMALNEIGVRAVSLTADQAGIVAGGRPGAGVVERVDVARLLDHLRHRDVAVVAGFQGRDASGELLTLGRGGSDTTAVALAAALGGRDCEIRTDVDGVRTADPRVVTGTRPLRGVSYEVMAELAGNGAAVLNPRSVALAALRGVRVRVAHSSQGGPGTAVGEPLEGGHRVVGIAHERDVWLVRVDLTGVSPGEIDAGLATLVERGVVPDVLTCHDEVELRCTVRGTARAGELVGEVARDIAAGATVTGGLGSVSVVGVRLLDHPRYLATTLRILADLGTTAVAMATSPSRCTVVVPADRVEPAVRALHDAFGLGTGAGL